MADCREKPPQPRSNFLTNDCHIILGSYPSEENIQSILDCNVDVFVNLIPGPITYEKYLPNDVEIIHLPIKAGGVPKMADMKSLINEVLTAYYNGKTIYIHCAGGRARSGVVGSILYGKIYDCDAYDAINETYRLINSREDKSRNFIPVPETNKQVKMVVSFLGLQKGHLAPDRSDKKWLSRVRKERKERKEMK